MKNQMPQHGLIKATSPVDNFNLVGLSLESNERIVALLTLANFVRQLTCAPAIYIKNRSTLLVEQGFVALDRFVHILFRELEHSRRYV